MTYKEYEIFVKNYFEKKLRVTFNDLEVHHQQDLKTATGIEYNIDLNYKFTLSGIEYLTIIECKHWKRAIDRDLILTLKEKANVLGAHKAIMVTATGFQSGAIEYAKEKGVGLIKMTKTGEAEIFTNFTSVELAQIEEKLQEETEISDDDNFDNSIGIIYPQLSAEEYIGRKYGEEVLSVISEYDKQSEKDQISPEMKSIVNLIPDNWYKEYEIIEKCGLQLKLANEREVRLLNVLIVLLKY